MAIHKTARSSDPIFILGHLRSGTTLLRYIIDTHPSICCPAELQVGELCDHLYRVIDLTVGRASFPDKEARHQQSIRQTRRIVSQIMRSYGKARNKPLWCDKSPGNLMYMDSLRAVFPTARYICLYRHCMDVVSSCAELWPFASGSVPVFLQQHYDLQGHDIVRAVIASWCDRTSMMIDLAEQIPEACSQMKFESLVADPAPMLERMFEFLGVEWDERLLDNIFSTDHDRGPGDLKVIASRGIRKDVVGKGHAVSIDHVGRKLLDRMERLLNRLGYTDYIPASPAAETQEAKPAAEPVVSDVSELFTAYFPRQLEKYSARLTDLKGIVKFVLTGPRGGVWTVDLQSKPRLFASGDATAHCSFSASSGDLLDIINQRLNPGVAFNHRKLRIEGDVDLAEELAWVLFGQ